MLEHYDQNKCSLSLIRAAYEIQLIVKCRVQSLILPKCFEVLEIGEACPTYKVLSRGCTGSIYLGYGLQIFLHIGLRVGPGFF